MLTRTGANNKVACVKRHAVYKMPCSLQNALLFTKCLEVYKIPTQNARAFTV